MKKLYDKIYNAVNEGIQKALLINPEQNDVSINYSYHKINNNVNLMSLYVEEFKKFSLTSLFGKDPDAIDLYNNIMYLYQNNGCLYKVSNIKEFEDLLLKISMIDESDFIGKWIDTTNVASIILKDGTEIPLHLYNVENNENAVLIKIVNNGHELIFPKNPYNDTDIIDKKFVPKYYKWCKTNYINGYNTKNCKASIYNDYDGWDHTYKNINIQNNDFSDYPAFQYVDKLNVCNGYDAYVPGVQEIFDVVKVYYYITSHILNLIGSSYEKYTKVLEKGCWTSLEASESSAYYVKIKAFANGETVKVCDANEKNKIHLVIPFFKKNNSIL